MNGLESMRATGNVRHVPDTRTLRNALASSPLIEDSYDRKDAQTRQLDC